MISTHSPRAGRTLAHTLQYARKKNFNSLAPCGANQGSKSASAIKNTFQLTRPVRGEPFTKYIQHWYKINFNSLAPCGANHLDKTIKNGTPHFNSLAPCGANRKNF